MLWCRALLQHLHGDVIMTGGIAISQVVTLQYVGEMIGYALVLCFSEFRTNGDLTVVPRIESLKQKKKNEYYRRATSLSIFVEDVFVEDHGMFSAWEEEEAILTKYIFT